MAGNSERRVTWDYSKLAQSYRNRAPYCKDVISEIIGLAGLNHQSTVCDMGAGTGFLSREFDERNIKVNAIEPNDEMRRLGELECRQTIRWYKGTAEDSKQPDNSADMVSFGSSFNVVNRKLAMQEAERICRPGGWFLAVWNHRDLTDELQLEIEDCINRHIPSFSYGLRREDHSQYLKQQEMIVSVQSVKGGFIFRQSKEGVIDAWRSHATLQRQAGDLFSLILDEIAAIINKIPENFVETKFTTQSWLAQFRL